MLAPPAQFEYTYDQTQLIYGTGCVAELGARLEKEGLDQAVVVCGNNVGSNTELMETIREGLDKHFVEIFDETRPDKPIQNAFDGLEVVKATNADVIVAVGGGSSIDVARMMSVLDSDGRPLQELRTEAQENGTIRPVTGGDEILPVVVIPTTFAGADISAGGSLMVSDTDEPPTGEVQRVRIDDERAKPVQAWYDPELFETTPRGAIDGSAMNGFDKGLETIYASGSHPITDATAVRGLQFMRDGFLSPERNRVAIKKAIVGLILVQFERQTSIIHAVGHGFARRYPVQQGKIHAVMAPHVLEDLFNHVDAKRYVLAHGLQIDTTSLTPDQIADEVVSEVTRIRDSLNVPTQLQEIDPLSRDDFTRVAEFIVDDYPMERTPEGYDPSVQQIESLLDEAW